MFAAYNQASGNVSGQIILNFRQRKGAGTTIPTPDFEFPKPDGALEIQVECDAELSAVGQRMQERTLNR